MPRNLTPVVRDHIAIVLDLPALVVDDVAVVADLAPGEGRFVGLVLAYPLQPAGATIIATGQQLFLAALYSARLAVSILATRRSCARLCRAA